MEYDFWSSVNQGQAKSLNIRARECNVGPRRSGM